MATAGFGCVAMAADSYVDAEKTDEMGDGLSWANTKMQISVVFSFRPLFHCGDQN